MITIKEADKIIKQGRTVIVVDKNGDVFDTIFVSRAGLIVKTIDGGRFDRSDLTIVAKAPLNP